MSTDGRVVLVSAPDEAVAESLVRRLVEERVVACGTILPAVSSIYRWEDGVEHEKEALVIFKTTAAGAERLVQRVPELHPYEVPEVLVLGVEAGHPPYLEWLTNCTD
jgi:periplasmic divalent cation tolerance protein